MRFLIINGPNLNLLGTREPDVYGSATLHELEAQWRHHGAKSGVGIDAFQSNHEGGIIDELHGSGVRHDAIIINAGAYAHTSYAIHDAIVAVGKPTVEVHISDIHDREPWRATSVLEPATLRMISGRGTRGYLDAIDLLLAQLQSPSRPVPYGPDPDQIMDVRVPNDPHGVVMLIHGGFWRRIWARDLMDPLAADLAARGFTTANVEYRRGPGSFDRASADVTAAIDALVTHLTGAGSPTGPITLVGHSAGGHLAAREAVSRAGGDGIDAVLLAPVLDIDRISDERPEDDPVVAYLGGSSDTLPDVWARARIDRLPPELTLIHGTDDEDVPIDHTRAIADRDGLTPVEVIGTGHMDLIDPRREGIESIAGGLARRAPST